MTDQELTQKELQKFWEYFNAPQGNPITLEFLFEDAVPKLQDKGFIIVLTAWEHKGYTCTIEHIAFQNLIFIIKADKPEVALFRAIQEAIK